MVLKFFIQKEKGKKLIIQEMLIIFGFILAPTWNLKESMCLQYYPKTSPIPFLFYSTSNYLNIFCRIQLHAHKKYCYLFVTKKKHCWEILFHYFFPWNISFSLWYLRKNVNFMSLVSIFHILYKFSRFAFTTPHSSNIYLLVNSFFFDHFAFNVS